jgi:hypothetical protein
MADWLLSLIDGRLLYAIKQGMMVRLMLAVLRVLYQRNGTLMERSCMQLTSDFVVLGYWQCGGSYSLMVRGGLGCCWEFKRDFSSGLMQVLVWQGCLLWMQTECCGDGGGCSAELKVLSVCIVDVELTCLLKSPPFLLLSLSLAYLISLSKSCP